MITTDGRDQSVIRDRAFALWEEEGRPEGKNVDHWLRAEAEIGTGKIIGIADNGKRLRPNKTELVVSRRRRRSSPTR